MKKINTFTALILAGILFTACKKENNSSPGPGKNKTFIKMKVDGREWYDETVAVSGVSTFDNEYNMSITGTNENFEGGKSGLSIILSSKTDITEGNYDMKDYEGGVTVTQVDGKTYLMTNSSKGADFRLNISAIQSSGNVRRIKGTFSGTLLGPTPGDVITITEGAFSGY